MSFVNAEHGYVVRVVNQSGDYWLGQRVYKSYESALVVKHNLSDSGRYQRVYVLPATSNQRYELALSVVD